MVRRGPRRYRGILRNGLSNRLWVARHIDVVGDRVLPVIHV